MSPYSATPLLKKLGYKRGQRACLIAAPPEIPDLLAFDGVAERRLIAPDALDGETGPFDLVHLFVTEAAVLTEALAHLRPRLAMDGMLWVSWPKKASKRATDVSETVVRAAGLAAGLVDIKICAVDATWSGLKFVVPRANRR